MLRHCLAMTLLITTSGFASTVGADEPAVRKMIEEYSSAFNRKDSKAVAGFWSEQGVHVDRETGARTDGRDAIRADLELAFKERPETQLSGRIGSVRMIKPDVAMVDGEAVLETGAEEGAIQTSFSALVVKVGEDWKIDTMTEFPLVSDVGAEPVVEVPRAHENLKVLDWLIGRWVDVSKDGQVDTALRWSSNGNFLIRTTVAQTAGEVDERGTQIIGWDARSRQIRSWSFNSDGSFGDATWFQSGDDWLIKSSRSLATGEAASGTYVLSAISPDEIQLQLIGQVIEGEPQPASMTVTMVRVPDETVGANEVVESEAVDSEAAESESDDSNAKQ